MTRPPLPLAIALALAILAGPASAQGPPFELRDGDRVVLIGGTMVERDQESGYLETRLTRRHPDRTITFRNLGWSGDTVEGVSRAGFGSIEDGFKHLVDHVLALKPTVVILGYGAVEAFDGPAGLPKFLAGLDRLLKAIGPAGARLVFLSPTRQENLGPPLPDPTRHNADLALYRDAIRAEAAKRGAAFVDLFGLLDDGAKATPPRPLTGNGLHFTPYGGWRMAAAVEGALFDGGPVGLIEDSGVVEFASNDDATKVVVTFSGPGSGEVDLLDLEATGVGVRFKLLGKILPAPPGPGGGPPVLAASRKIAVPASKPGRYTLKVDGKPIATADAEAWKGGVAIEPGRADLEQVEALRAAINAKNELYFHRWRPQNETYLFGFRKHEQGQNAREIPRFDPLVAAKEAEIARLRVPVPHTYELIREGEVGR